MVETDTNTGKIAGFIVDAAYEDIPPEAVIIAKQGVLDWLGVAIAGASEPVVAIIAQYAKGLAAKEEASGICQGFMTTAELASLINGSMGHALDFDDTFANSARYNIHPTTCILPAALAVVERLALTGRDLLLSYVAGMETTYRVGAAIGQSIPGIGWYPTPILGTIGAAAACAKALRLDASQTRSALGIASSLASGLKKNVETMTKTMHAGNGARNGVIAATLAQGGFTGNPSVLDGRISFCEVFSGGRAPSDVMPVDDLGKEWWILSTGLGFKPYPCCRATHPSIDAILYLKKRYGIRPEQVASITCRLNPLVLGMTTAHRPKAAYEAKFSMEYCIAKSIMNGEVTMNDFTDQKVQEAEWQELIPCIQFEHPPQWGHGAVDLLTEIVIRLDNGETYAHTVSVPKGEPENPMSQDELVTKLRQLSNPVFGSDRTDELLAIIQDLDGTDNLGRFFEVLRRQD
ncbi:MAG TPA: MmgE/PrpD family protein [Syntrophorhabdaceae bacterium]|nr:MmgE/PrpD family protein [Syntrophorhabdaceae bacterium]HQM82832.1 MmgE/PrpD family protein [Syntrophorhabdaceae bacterium]